MGVFCPFCEIPEKNSDKSLKKKEPIPAAVGSRYQLSLRSVSVRVPGLVLVLVGSVPVVCLVAVLLAVLLAVVLLVLALVFLIVFLIHFSSLLALHSVCRAAQNMIGKSCGGAAAGWRCG